MRTIISKTQPVIGPENCDGSHATAHGLFRGKYILEDIVRSE